MGRKEGREQRKKEGLVNASQGKVRGLRSMSLLRLPLESLPFLFYVHTHVL